MNIYTALPGIAAVSLLTAGATLVSTSQPAAATHPAATLTAATLSADEETTEFEGKIAAVSASQNQFTMLVADETDAKPRRVTVKVNADTAYTLDGEESTMKEALQTDRMAEAAVKQGVATRVDVTTRAE